jgi:hypothetical protein
MNFHTTMPDGQVLRLLYQARKQGYEITKIVPPVKEKVGLPIWFIVGYALHRPPEQPAIYFTGEVTFSHITWAQGEYDLTRNEAHACLKRRRER